MTTEFWNGNMAAAVAARQARVQVIAAYPITPQTHTVEYLSQFIQDDVSGDHQRMVGARRSPGTSPRRVRLGPIDLTHLVKQHGQMI